MTKTQMYIDVGYRGRVYRVFMEDTGQTFKQKRRKRTTDLQAAIKAENCDKCKGLMLNNVCMNPKCSVNLRRDSGPMAAVPTP